MTSISLPSLSVRSYGLDGPPHTHEFEQIVLPIQGAMDIEIEGRGARLARGLAAFIPRDARHAQSSPSKNRFLVLDIPTDALGGQSAEYLARRKFIGLSPAAEHLIHYMVLSMDGACPPASVRHWVPLLLDALETREAGGPSRLAPVLDAIGARLARRWTVADMARLAGVSASRIHVLFREELNTSPRAWLAERRLEQVRDWLASTPMSIAEIAGRAGYSDQTALTRAFRQATDFTPAEYRRRRQQSASKAQ